MNFYEKVYRLAYIIRYSNVPRVKDESVAEHSFFVASLVMELHDKYFFDLGKALQTAISHDMPESETNDISWEIKQRYPEIKEVLSRAEETFAKKMPISVQKGLKFFQEDTIETKIVMFADAIQCYQYSANEVSLGNRGYMESVLVISRSRIEEFEKELKEYER